MNIQVIYSQLRHIRQRNMVFPAPVYLPQTNNLSIIRRHIPNIVLHTEIDIHAVRASPLFADICFSNLHFMIMSALFYTAIHGISMHNRMYIALFHTQQTAPQHARTAIRKSVSFIPTVYRHFSQQRRLFRYTLRSQQPPLPLYTLLIAAH